MSTTITPAIGNGALFTQQGVGTSPGYSAIDDRRAATLALQEGVYGASDFMVVQRGIGANLSVDIGMPAGGFALVQGDSVAGQALYTVPVHSSTVNEALATADPTNPRVDQVILEVLDNVHDASGSNLARTRVLTGTPTAGATLANRTGAAALPSSALLLADVLVGNAAATIDNTKIRDRRKFARGGFVRMVRTSGNESTSSTTHTAMDTTFLQCRLECSGAPLEISFNAIASNSTGGDGAATGLQLDGAQIDGTTDLGAMNGTVTEFVGFYYSTVPAAGSHLFTATMRALSGGVATFLSTAQSPLVLTVREVARQNSGNNTVTSG